MNTEQRLAHIEEMLDRAVQRIEALELPRGEAATGACMCRASPESVEADCARLLETWELRAKSQFPRNAFIDHRCPKHGEKAQPALWGRHKEKELQVTYAQWQSLGVKHEETQK